MIGRITAITNPDTLHIRIRELPIYATKQDYFNHASGGSFRFGYFSKEVIAELNNTKILSSVLSETK